MSPKVVPPPAVAAAASPRLLDAGGPLLAALLEALWVGTLAALIASSAPAGWVALCFGLIAAAALLAARARRAAAAGAAAALARGDEPPPTVTAAPAAYRLALLAVGAGTTAAITAATAPHGLRETAGALIGAVLLVGACLELGVLVGRAELDPDRALRRALRGFVLLFAVVFLAALGGHAPAGAGVLVAVAVLAAAGLIVVVRMRAIVAAVEDGVPPVRWIAVVLLADLIALALALLLTAAPLHGGLAWLSGPLAAGLRGLLDVIGFVAAAAAYVVARGLAALLALLHLHLHLPATRPGSSHPLRPAGQRPSHSDPLVAAIAVVAAAVVALVVWLVTRSLRVERRAGEETVVEEHERLAHEPELRAAGRRLARRLRRLVERDRTPAEALRAEYRRLERTLRRAGHERAPSQTVRRYLAACLAADESRDATDRLVSLYERARYAGPAGGLDWRDVEEFRRARRELRLPSRP